MDWKQATRSQLYEIAYNDRGCNPRHRIEARAEIERRHSARRANVKWRAMGRNWG